MSTKPKIPADTNQRAKFVVDLTTDEENKYLHKKHEGRQKAGKIGAAKRNKNLTHQQREEIAHIAAQARWKKSN